MNKVMTDVLSTVIPLMAGLAFGLALSANLRYSRLEDRVDKLVKWGEITSRVDAVQSRMLGRLAGIPEAELEPDVAPVVPK